MTLKEEYTLHIKLKSPVKVMLHNIFQVVKGEISAVTDH